MIELNFPKKTHLLCAFTRRQLLESRRCRCPCNCRLLLLLLLLQVVHMLQLVARNKDASTEAALLASFACIQFLDFVVRFSLPSWQLLLCSALTWQKGGQRGVPTSSDRSSRRLIWAVRFLLCLCGSVCECVYVIYLSA